jgi:REP element-mobilizing transposase RayT
MSRQPRLDVAGERLHVFARGVDKCRIVRDDDDREAFLRELGFVIERCAYTCLGYCLMNTHYHLFLRLQKATLSSGIQRLNGCYAMTFNRRHGRVGHLFQGRFGALHVDSDSYFLNLYRYIMLNPVRAGICTRPEDYVWSSYGSTIGLAPPDPLVDDTELLALFANDKATARGRLRTYVDEPDRRKRWGQTRVRPRPAF